MFLGGNAAPHDIRKKHTKKDYVGNSQKRNAKKIGGRGPSATEPYDGMIDVQTIKRRSGFI